MTPAESVAITASPMLARASFFSPGLGAARQVHSSSQFRRFSEPHLGESGFGLTPESSLMKCAPTDRTALARIRPESPYHTLKYGIAT